jgi:hypothetical protein
LAPALRSPIGSPLAVRVYHRGPAARALSSAMSSSEVAKAPVPGLRRSAESASAQVEVVVEPATVQAEVRLSGV